MLQNAHFRITISNPSINYYFLCGGTLTELDSLIEQNDQERADDISIKNEIIKGFINHQVDNESEQFWHAEFENGLRATLYKFEEDNNE